MEWISRLNLLHDKITGLLQISSELKSENRRLAEENNLLKSEAARLKEQLSQTENSTAQYLTERDSIKERVERLLQLFDEA